MSHANHGLPAAVDENGRPVTPPVAVGADAASVAPLSAEESAAAGVESGPWVPPKERFRLDLSDRAVRSALVLTFGGLVLLPLVTWLVGNMLVFPPH